MRKLFLAVAAISLAACGTSAAPEDSSEQLGTSSDALSSSAPACPGPALDGTARCHARVRGDAKGNPAATTAPSGLGPADIQSAYALPSSTAGSGMVVAIVDAYDNANAEADLATYRSTYGLPPCTTANGCFKKVNQNGVAGSYPRGDAGWALESSLDLDAVSAACPNCKIILVEASSSSMANLGTAVNTAVSLGANVVSNSYGGGEYSGEVTDEVTYFKHPGVVITVSSGDSGYGVEFPAASQFVTAVGGTTLTRASNARGWTEAAWSGSGSGCSSYVAKPSWQTDSGCAKRSVADLSAVADPASGLSVYDTNGYQGLKGWFTVGGTSASAPLVGAMYALAGNTSSVTYASYPYSHASSLFDVTSGSNGSCGTYLCNSGTGYDGPTGLGSPNGTGAL